MPGWLAAPPKEGCGMPVPTVRSPKKISRSTLKLWGPLAGCPSQARGCYESSCQNSLYCLLLLLSHQCIRFDAEAHPLPPAGRAGVGFDRIMPRILRFQREGERPREPSPAVRSLLHRGMFARNPHAPEEPTRPPPAKPPAARRRASLRRAHGLDRCGTPAPSSVKRHPGAAARAS